MDEDQPHEVPDGRGATLAYASFGTLLNLVERMEREGIPRRIDRSFLSNLAGGVQAQLIHAMKTLGLIGPEEEVLEPLHELVTQPENRQALVRRLLAQHYDWVPALGSNATHLQLDEAFKERGPRLGTHTRRKAITFYLHAAKYAEVPVSPFFKGKTVGNASASRRAPSRRGKPTRQKSDGASPDQVGVGTRSAESEMRQRYFEVLLKKAEDSEQLEDGLLDRIEKLIGLEEVTP